MSRVLSSLPSRSKNSREVVGSMTVSCPPSNIRIGNPNLGGPGQEQLAPLDHPEEKRWADAIVAQRVGAMLLLNFRVASQDARCGCLPSGSPTGATLASNRPSLSLRGAIGTATRSAGFETTSPSIELMSRQHEAEGDLPAIGVAENKPRARGQLACGPCQDAREIADQIVVSLHHAPPAGAAAVAPVVDGDHVEIEPACPATSADRR